MNIFSLLDRSAARYPNLGAVYQGSEQLFDYSQLHERALALAGTLRHHLSLGDRYVIASKNCPEYLEMMFAGWAAGLVVVPVNAKLHPREIAGIVVQAGAALVFASPEIAQGLEPLLDESGRSPAIIPIGGALYENMMSNRHSVEEVEPDSIAWLFYTSGTTGRSKGAMLSHRNLTAMSIAYLADFESVEPEQSMIHAAPMSHGSGLYALPFVGRGARHVIPGSGAFDPAEYIALCRTHPRCTSFFAPTMVRRLCREIETNGAHPLNLNTLIYGGGPMYVQDLLSARACLGDVLIQLYGQGEAPMTITSLTRRDHCGDDLAMLGSVGWARSGVEIRIADEDGNELPSGEIGEICCRSDVVMQGYWNDPAATAVALSEGWLRTGDLGFMEADGRLTLRDRYKDVIISGGSNIYPREVEEVLLAHPSVAEACVVGMPNREWGEVVVAFIVSHTEGLNADELDRHCLGHIARFKRPRDYLFVDALPKNNYGKVLKRELTSRLAPPKFRI